MLKLFLLVFSISIAQAHDYQYNAVVTNVVDGDTVDMDIDLGFHVTLKDERIRLYGINAPEIRGAEKESGQKAREWLVSRVLGKVVVLHSIKDKTGKFGRYLGEIYVDGVNINRALVESGNAMFKDY